MGAGGAVIDPAGCATDAGALGDRRAVIVGPAEGAVEEAGDGSARVTDAIAGAIGEEAEAEAEDAGSATLDAEGWRLMDHAPIPSAAHTAEIRTDRATRRQSRGGRDVGGGASGGSGGSGAATSAASAVR